MIMWFFFLPAQLESRGDKHLAGEPRRSMNEMQPIFDPTTHYRIEIQDQVDVNWLQGFDSSLEIFAGDLRHSEGSTVLIVYTDQSGIIGLLRRLHGLGMTILQLQVLRRKEV
jgi:hypothetical protein